VGRWRGFSVPGLAVPVLTQVFIDQALIAGLYGWLRPVVAMVDQDIVLFAGSVRENLTLWDSTVPDAHLIRACKDAALHEVILALPGATTAPCSKAPPISAADSGSVWNWPGPWCTIRRSWCWMKRPVPWTRSRSIRSWSGCACLIVAHRLSTLRDCDEILGLEQGKVVQRGTHTTLLLQGGVYARLLRDADTGLALQEPAEGLGLTTSTTVTATMALEALAGVLDPGRSHLPTADGPPLLMAAHTVGAVLGVTVRPAAPSENPATLRAPGGHRPGVASPPAACQAQR
jgi:hypothetical protein